jgi:hypothetical protein
MIQAMKSNYFSLILAGLLFSAPPVLALDAAQFREQGRIESIDGASMTLVIGDSSYPLTPATRIYSPTGQPLLFNALQKGSTVKFNLIMPNESRQPVIREILVLPAK